MTSVVWVFGGSGAGKETFIKEVTSGREDLLFSLLNLKHQKIIPISESLEYIGKNEDDEILDKRDEILKKVKEISKNNNSIILIKGQDDDLIKRRPKRLKEELSDANHIIIFLYVKTEILFERSKKKWWWEEGISLEEFSNWLKFQVSELKKLKGFEIIVLDSSNTEYKRMEAGILR